jgi:hypothetical protein
LQYSFIGFVFILDSNNFLETDIMGLSRRGFLKSGFLAAAGFHLASCTEDHQNSKEIDYNDLDKVLNTPVIKRDLFTSPIILKTIELLEHKGNFICRVRSNEGVEGISISNNMQMQHLYPILTGRIIPFFIGNDARELDKLIVEGYVFKCK